MPRDAAALPIDLSKAIQGALKRIYNEKIDPYREIDPGLWKGIVDTIDIAAAEGLGGHPAVGRDFREQLLHNDQVFAAFKVHRLQGDMARRMVDEDGNLKSFERWAEDVKPIADHQCGRWLRTEYDTAVKRASLAADWQQFEDEKDVLPNLRWVPSTAAVPDAFHQSMWNTVLPVDHPFWSGHHPGDRWGCQCSLEATDDPATDVPEADYKTSPGLDNNPGIDAKLFNDSHPYFPDSCDSCPFRGARPSGPTNLAKDCYHCPYIQSCINELSGAERNERNLALFEKLKNDGDYIDVQFDESSGGVKASHKDHNFDKVGGQYEKDAQDVGFMAGHIVILGSEKSNVIGQRFTEGTWDGFRFEVAGRETATENNVLKGLKHCAKKRNTEIAVLVYPNGGFSEDILRKAIVRYRGLRGAEGNQYIAFSKVLCIQDGGIVFEEDF